MPYKTYQAKYKKFRSERFYTIEDSIKAIELQEE